MLKALSCFIISMSYIHGAGPGAEGGGRGRRAGGVAGRAGAGAPRRRLVRQKAGGLARARARPGLMKVMTESTRANLASYIMSTLESLTFADPLIRDRVLRGHSHQSIAEELQQQCPSLSRGLSTRSVRSFCSTNGIHRSSRLSAHEVDRVVEQGQVETEETES